MNYKFACVLIFSLSIHTFAAQTYTIVDTGQKNCFDNTKKIQCTKIGQPFFGQDAQYTTSPPAYKDNRDGTITDLNTNLMWTKDPGSKKTYKQALANAKICKVAGHTDWRLPTIKELYSLILFSGMDPDPGNPNTSDLIPFINKKYFDFRYGQHADGDRIIDSQFATSTIYRSTTMNGNKTMFGVNFADGRIKGYPINPIGPRPEKKFYALYVRDNTAYGKNDFHDNGDGTITDRATGLIWMKVDSGHMKAGKNKDGKLTWAQALDWAENLDYAGCSDWRLPNAKELQSIVDYSRCPDTTDSPAIDPIFQTSEIKNEAGKKDYPYFWTSTTHQTHRNADTAVYISFGRALGWMKTPRNPKPRLMDVHGAGAQRSDPKTGSPKNFPYGRGPQGDVIRIYNHARCIRTVTKQK